MFSWPFWDLGVTRSRTVQAELKIRQAQQQLAFQRREARLNWEKARATLRTLYREIEILIRAVPIARDSYLEAESRYRGGAATSLEVIDAYAAWVDAEVQLAEVTARYRVAQTLATRWGGP